MGSMAPSPGMCARSAPITTSPQKGEQKSSRLNRVGTCTKSFIVKRATASWRAEHMAAGGLYFLIGARVEAHFDLLGALDDMLLGRCGHCNDGNPNSSHLFLPSRPWPLLPEDARSWCELAHTAFGKSVASPSRLVGEDFAAPLSLAPIPPAPAAADQSHTATSGIARARQPRAGSMRSAWPPGLCDPADARSRHPDHAAR